MGILHDQRGRLAGGPRPQMFSQRMQQMLVAPPRYQIGLPIARANIKRQHRRQDRYCCCRIRYGANQQALQFFQFQFIGLRAANVGGVFDMPGEGVKRRVAVMGAALDLIVGLAVPRNDLAQRLCQPAFADAGFAADQDDLARTLPGLVPASLKPGSGGSA